MVMPFMGTDRPQRAGQPQVNQNAGPTMPFRGTAMRPPGAVPVSAPIMGGPQRVGMPVGGGAVPRPAPEPYRSAGPMPLGSFKKGGKVKKTGTYKLHAGERVLNKKQAKLVPVAALLRAKG